jgi:hypothetical protein
MEEDLENYMEEVLKCLSENVSKSHSSPTPPPLLPPLLSFIVNSQPKEEVEENEFLIQMKELDFEEEKVISEEVVEEKIISEEDGIHFLNEEVETKVDEPPLEVPTNMDLVPFIKETTMKEVPPLQLVKENMENETTMEVVKENMKPSIHSISPFLFPDTITEEYSPLNDSPLNPPLNDSPLNPPLNIVTTYTIVNTNPPPPPTEPDKKRKRNEIREHCLIFLEEFKKTLNQYNHHLCEIIFENKEWKEENLIPLEFDIFKEEEVMEEEEECGICLLELYDETPIVFYSFH